MTELGQGTSQLILVLVFDVVVIAAAVWLIGYLFPSSTHVASHKRRPKADNRLRPSLRTQKQPDAAGERPKAARQAAGKV